MSGKKIVVGISGGIAVYKTAELVRLLVKEGFYVRVAMTRNATQFVSPLTFEVLSGNKVIHDMFKQERNMEHILWAQDSDLIVIAPATANLIAKIAHGIADDFLTTMVLAATAGIIICPAMNTQMLMNPAVQDNLRILKERGLRIMEPGQGELACGAVGPGRLPEPEEIFEEIQDALAPNDLSGLRIMVTAGPTVEPIDPVRHITNRSSGKMGYAIAKMAKRRGASVILISGPVELQSPRGIKTFMVKTAEEMREKVLENYSDCDVVIKAAAVSDYRPAETSPQKIKKDKDQMILRLVKNPDILAELGRKKGQQILVGFAAETDELVANARKKLEKKGLDMIVANDVSRKDAGFGTDTNVARLIYRDGRIEDTGFLQKEQLADLILERIRDMIHERRAD
ncbi:MAG: bifunctional phosphopantothenoylcysteine decarboxylase/phosphopantothenate--cysteine ligase CoaBC [Deltaproteobacteria bacterium]|nr:MAG: bifunctional phosphopantothenoylcysteine decarboxylase/phosphopantothenate--cysteine ligase CoaBC [Deltaproteobacteria bacterium]